MQHEADILERCKTVKKKKPFFLTLEERDRLIWARKTQRKRKKAFFLGKLKEPIVQWLPESYEKLNGSWTLGNRVEVRRKR